ncbi:MAG: 16S rRNA (uracil(1498)-N(3))-methyltransferase [Salibacteraceae bacterium]
MKDHRIYAADANPGESIQVEADELQHLAVKRIKAGETVQVVNGKGEMFRAVVEQWAKNSASVRIEKLLKREENCPSLTIGVAPTKNQSRFEWMVEKSTEMGVREIFPIATKRSERTGLRQDRLHRIAVNAMKQSRRLWLPVIHPVTPIEEVIKLPYASKWIAHCDPEFEKSPLKKTASHSEVLVLIGPEGDFTEEEIQMAEKMKFKGLDLGTHRLRTETAAIAVCALVNLPVE